MANSRCKIGTQKAVWIITAVLLAVGQHKVMADAPKPPCPEEKAHLFATALTLVTEPGSKPAEEGTPEPRIHAKEQIIAIGDSITQAGGYLRAIDAVFEQQYPDLKIPRIINVGIGGQKAEDLVKRFDKDVIKHHPAIVTISIGINDVWHRLDKPHDEAVLKAYAANVEQMVKAAQAEHIRVLLLAPTVIEESTRSEGNLRLAKYVAVGKEIAQRNHCDYVDLHGMFLRVVTDKAATRPASTQPGSDFTVDGVHMKPLGDTLMAIGVLRALGVPDSKIAATDLCKMAH